MIEIVPVRASGDKVQDRPLAEIGGKALWTKELDAWLLAARSTSRSIRPRTSRRSVPPKSPSVPCCPREDVRDVLLGAATIAALPPGGRRHQRAAPRRAGCCTCGPMSHGRAVSWQCRDAARGMRCGCAPRSSRPTARRR
jgi:hydroxymethylbilane synthase